MKNKQYYREKLIQGLYFTLNHDLLIMFLEATKEEQDRVIKKYEQDDKNCRINRFSN